MSERKESSMEKSFMYIRILKICLTDFDDFNYLEGEKG